MLVDVERIQHLQQSTRVTHAQSELFDAGRRFVEKAQHLVLDNLVVPVESFLELWRKPLGIGLDVPRNASGMPVLVPPRVIVTSPMSRTLWVFDAATGRVLSRQELAAVHKGAVTAVGDDILLGDRKGNISLFRLPDGAPIGQCFAGSAFNVFGPRLVGKTLFVGTDDGWLHAVPYDSLRGRAVKGGARSCF